MRCPFQAVPITLSCMCVSKHSFIKLSSSLGAMELFQIANIFTMKVRFEERDCSNSQAQLISSRLPCMDMAFYPDLKLVDYIRYDEDSRVEIDIYNFLAISFSRMDGDSFGIDLLVIALNGHAFRFIVISCGRSTREVVLICKVMGHGIGTFVTQTRDTPLPNVYILYIDDKAMCT